MAQIRHEEQRYQNHMELMLDPIIDKANDVVYVESLNRAYRWIAGSTLEPTFPYVFDKITNPTGRFVAESVAKVINGTTATVPVIQNGNSQPLTATATGVVLGRKNEVVITNADQIPTDVFITFKEIVANDTVRFLVENQSGADTASFDIEFSVLEN